MKTLDERLAAISAELRGIDGQLFRLPKSITDAMEDLDIKSQKYYGYDEIPPLDVAEARTRLNRAVADAIADARREARREAFEEAGAMAGDAVVAAHIHNHTGKYALETLAMRFNAIVGALLATHA